MSGLKPIPWTHSHLERFKNCPHQLAEVKVHKHFPDEVSDGGWGNWVHDQIPAYYVKHVPWHENMLPYVPAIDAAVEWAQSGTCMFERRMAIDTTLRQCDFFDRGVWARAVADVLSIHITSRSAKLIDWKTGKFKEDNEQLLRSALIVFQSYEDVDTIDILFEWLQHPGRGEPMRYVREQLPEMWRSQLPLLTKFKNAFVMNDFPKRPSGLCRGYCPVSTCEHWGPKR